MHVVCVQFMHKAACVQHRMAHGAQFFVGGFVVFCRGATHQRMFFGYTRRTCHPLCSPFPHTQKNCAFFTCKALHDARRTVVCWWVCCRGRLPGRKFGKRCCVSVSPRHVPRAVSKVKNIWEHKKQQQQYAQRCAPPLINPLMHCVMDNVQTRILWEARSHGRAFRRVMLQRRSKND